MIYLLPILGFETIGNATLILYDGGPVLATDPWINGDANFGSWGHSYEIPAEQRSAIKAYRRLWFSHAHPDHTNVDSLYLAGAIADGLVKGKHNVVMPAIGWAFWAMDVFLPQMMHRYVCHRWTGSAAVRSAEGRRELTCASRQRFVTGG